MVSPLACVAGPCGTIAAGLMGVGIIDGQKKAKSITSDRCFTNWNEIHFRIYKKFGSILCIELIKIDLSTMKGMAQYRKDNILENQCYLHVIGSLEIIQDSFKRRLIKLEKENKL